MPDEQAREDERGRREQRPAPGTGDHGSPDEHGAAAPGARREYVFPDDRSPRLLLVGHLTEDVAGDRTRLGGAVAYAGLLAHRSGVPTTILTAVDDGFPHLAPLGGIRIHRVPSPGRTRFVNDYRADGSRTQRMLGRARPIPDDVLRAAVRRLPGGSAVLYAPVAGELDGAAPLPLPTRSPGSAVRAGAIVQGFLRRRAPSGRVSIRWGEDVFHRIAGLDFLSLSEEELPVRRRPSAPVMAVTRGARGAVIHRPGRQDLAVLPQPVRAVDPTGAGDVFAAALFLLLWRGEPLVRAGRIAAAAAAITVGAVGVRGTPGLAEAATRAGADW